MRAVRLSFRSSRFEVTPERGHLYGRIKGLLEKAEEIANGHSGESVKVRLKAMEVAARLAQFLAGVLKDVQLDEIEAEIRKLEGAEEEG
jgi:ATP-dependent RNA circularization protein (DNA/RNA ligase family)